MSPPEVASFLDGSLKVQVATVGPSGAPHLSTLFYVLDRGRIAFWTYRASQKVRNLQRDPRVSALVEAGEDYQELRGVSITGRAELVTDPDAVRALGSRVMTRMLAAATDGPTEPDVGRVGERVVAQQTPKRVGVIVIPERIASWDHRKLGLG